ncbi:GTP 3',8-cyclase MoaA [Aminivibrio sp.]|jgi:cyclic pyranopterin phosphate synthase|uniref:GTP 3',8-cyclase MoaA n=1 Tax=Aminivibrio sp. TaxID=1872489 RepID=UPI001A45FA43|nr:GTP 3',8-cyclase MoaA [Aminivibrio sp.]MBL3538914.1 GTP 3',8-cyclase MoaA [Aminivibrio sp.]
MAGIIQDSFGRVLDYVRISITDRCNFRCIYCMPADGIEWIPHGNILSYEDLLFLCRALTDLGVRKIRFTGGEPFVRKGFVPFLESVKEAYPNLRIAVTTNGSLLEKWAERIARLGLDSLNVSLDTLDHAKFLETTRTGDLERVLRGIDAVRQSGGVPLKLNSVVMRNFNLDEIPALVGFAAEKGATIRFIEFMPLDKDVWSQSQFVPAEEILSRLPDPALWRSCPPRDNRSEICGPSRYFQNSATGRMVGIISAVSDHFCHLCNRLRVTSTGVMRPCLFGNFGFSLFEALRGKDSEALREGIMKAVSRKPQRGETGIPSPEEGRNSLQEERHMSQIGG